MATDAAEGWVTKKVDFQEHEAAMTSSERFFLGEDWDKLSIKTIFRKKSMNAIGLQLQVTKVISGKFKL
jgi:hypothetical protein